MKLIAIDETKLESVLEVLEPAILESRREGTTESLEKLLLLKNYLRTRLETAPEVPTASSMGRKGGRSRSHKKLRTARKNAKKAGPPGTYYACLVVCPETAGSNDSRKVIYYQFHDKQSRDEWVNRGPKENNESGSREAVFAINRLFSAVKRKDPAAIAEGDRCLQLKLERDRLFDQFEREHETADECDGCGDLIELKESKRINQILLCRGCVSFIK
ncbi:MAG: hypothetical protein K8F91_27165 [Candidatus Obscuribacterales bacterium]|nr:hypothetical protein [Candidatus Obscuribacterales bacterium]